MRDQAATSTRDVRYPTRHARHPLRALVLPLALALAACGGGGGGGGGTPMTPMPTPTPTPTPTGTAGGPYSQTGLVSNVAGSAVTVDSNLANPWGLSMVSGDPVWVANNGTQTSTIYDGNGKVQQTAVKLPAGAGNVPFSPTGIVGNTTAGFMVSAGGKTGPALFIYSGKAGMLAGWAPTVDVTNAVTAYADTAGAAYTGLAIASNAGGNFLYAADFHNNKIDVFNAAYQKQAPSATSFSFTDSTLPPGYAPFGIQAVNNGAGGATQIYVAYAKQGAGNESENSPGFGLVDVFDTNGKLLSTPPLIAVGGALNAPWGIALAPADFGPLSNDLLIGNFGDGTINAYKPTTGAFVAAVSNSAGNPLVASGLWGIVFGNDSDNQPHNTLFYAAGIDMQADGVYGRIDVGATPPILNKAPVVTITAPPPSMGGGGGPYGGGGGTTIGGTVAVTATATSTDSVAIAKVQFFANGNPIGNPVTASPYTVQWNTTTVANGSSVALTAKATDVDGNVGTSATVTVIVKN